MLNDSQVLKRLVCKWHQWLTYIIENVPKMRMIAGTCCVSTFASRLLLRSFSAVSNIYGTIKLYFAFLVQSHSHGDGT